MSVSSFAAQLEKLHPDQVGVQKIDETNVIANILTTTYIWAGIICVLIIVIAGFFFVTSAGNAATVKRARDAIFGAVIGLVVILMAFAITAFVIGRF